MYRSGATVENVAEILMRYLWIALITPEEAKELNKKYKTTMPQGWVLGKDDPLARLQGTSKNP